MMEELKIINKGLLDTYGKTLDGKPRFRVIWSEQTFETRLGDFEDYTPAGIFIRRSREVRQVKKYSYLKDRFILEAYMPEQKSNPEVMNGDGYEPLFVFQSSKGEFLKPHRWACDYVISRYLTAIGGEVVKKNEDIVRREHEEEIDKEAAKFVEYLENESSDMMNSFRYGESVILPGKELN
jgi:hypothetical protein